MIYLNLKDELNNWAVLQLKQAGYNNVRVSEALEQYYNVALRCIMPKPRTIMKSKQFVCPSGYESKLHFFEDAVTQGKYLKPFMTKNMLDASFQDKMLFDWGLYHFHLSDTVDTKDNRFMARSGQLLIAYKDWNNDGIIYFLQVVSHQQLNLWTTQVFIRCLADNWPAMMEQYRLPGIIDTEFSVSDAEFAGLRSANVNSFVNLGDGRVYIGSNLGLTGTGYSVRAQLHLLSVNKYTSLTEKLIKEKSVEILTYINVNSKTSFSDLTLHIQAFRDKFFFFEIEEIPEIVLLVNLKETPAGSELNYRIV